MKTKNTLMLIILVLLFGFTNSPGSGKSRNGPDHGPDSNLVFGNDSKVNCQLQTKSSTVRPTGGGNLTVSINSNWLCR